MELTSKRRISGKEKRRRKERGKGTERGELGISQAVVLAAACFFISRACFMGQMFPAGISLLTVLLSRNPLNLYLLPFLLLGVGSYYKSGIPIVGDLAALCGGALVFLCAGRLSLRTWQKALIAGSIVVIANSVYYIAGGMLYRLSMQQLVLEGLLTAALCGVFDRSCACGMLRTKSAENNQREGTEAEGIFSFCSGFMLAAVGSGIPWLLFPLAMAAVLFAGYFFGVSGGILSAVSCSLVLLLCNGEFLAVFLLLAGGVTAGFLQRQSRILTSLCFCAAVLGMGLPDLSANMSVPFYAPVAAAALLVLMPVRWMNRFESALGALLNGEGYGERQTAIKTAEYLKKVRKNFDDLSALFAGQDNHRQLLSYEFRAISRILDHTRQAADIAPVKTAVRYRSETAWAGYAGEQGVSGDSVLWEELPDGNFVIVLSDGMGKGRTAAAESSLAVTTVIQLLKAGLDAELVLKILNSILLLNAEKEVFSTIDLGILNQKTGKMKFYKIGAAPTFIKRRNKQVESLNVSALPMGIVEGIHIDYVETSLSPGDQVILISDGVTDSKREDAEMKWLTETIMGIRSKDPQTMCDLIMNRAVENYGLREKDDLTVATVRME